MRTLSHLPAGVNRILRPSVFLLSLVPLAWLIGRAFTTGLGADPVATITHHTGDWTLNFLLITLAITPVRRLTGWNWLAGYRRMVGLFAFFYICLHFATYLVFDHFFSWVSIVEDVVKRRYITVGFTGFVLLIPLAATSTARMVRRLGARRWQALHRLVYVVVACGVLHYLWSVKRDIRYPLIYALILIALLGFRALHERLKGKLPPLPSPSPGRLDPAP